MNTRVSADPWQRLEGKFDLLVLHAPKTGGDPQGDWPRVHERIVNYLERAVAGKPWADHLALMAAVKAASHRDVQTIMNGLWCLNTRLTQLFSAFGLHTMQEWKGEQHIPAYLKAEVLPGDSQLMRTLFWNQYNYTSKQVLKWLVALPEREQHTYQAFLLPLVDRYHVEGLIKEREVKLQQRQARKVETEAVVPHYAALRVQAHFRYNRVVRLRQAYQQACLTIEREQPALPFAFSYEEGANPARGIPPQERLFFRVWDRRSFVLAHAADYSDTPISGARQHLQAFDDQHNHLYLEFVRAERLGSEAPPEGWWFSELLRLGILGVGPTKGTAEEVARQQQWLHEWGYGEGGPEMNSAPFDAHLTGVLTWTSRPGDSQFIRHAQPKAEGVFIPVEPFYVAATFGLLAFDVFTSTGMRSNELMQISLSKECIGRVIDTPPPGAKEQSLRTRYFFRLIPKGERTDTRATYFVSKETIRLVERVGHLLQEHYELQPGEALPLVPFEPGHGRSHRFGPAPYLFQYNHLHLRAQGIIACMRFLLHGMLLPTREGKQVVLKPHLLRHSFATYAVQVEKFPVDVVAIWLKQKDLETTRYYSQMPEMMVAQEHASFLSRLSAPINVRELVLRSPEEVRQQVEEAKRRVGTLVSVTGGECTLHAYCPAQFMCIGCAAKAPDPEKRYQVEEKKWWAGERLAYYTQEDLVLEAERMKQLLRDCDAELQEMDWIEAYRRDEHHVITIQPRKLQ